MSAKHLKTEAVVLRAVKYRESDFMLTLLIPELGKTGVIARGARKSSKRFGGALQTAAIIHAELAAGKGRGWSLSEAEFLGGGFSSDNFGAFAQISYFCELALRISQEGENSVELFEFLKKLFWNYQKKGHTLLEFMLFEVRFLELTGFKPQLERCSVCGKKPDGKSPFYTTPCEGIIYCEERKTPSSIKIPPVEAAALAFLASRVLPDEGFGDKINYPLIRKIISDYVTEVAGAKMKSESLLMQPF